VSLAFWLSASSWCDLSSCSYPVFNKSNERSLWPFSCSILCSRDSLMFSISKCCFCTFLRSSIILSVFKLFWWTMSWYSSNYCELSRRTVSMFYSRTSTRLLRMVISLSSFLFLFYFSLFCFLALRTLSSQSSCSSWRFSFSFSSWFSCFLSFSRTEDWRAVIDSVMSVCFWVMLWIWLIYASVTLTWLERSF